MEFSLYSGKFYKFWLSIVTIPVNENGHLIFRILLLICSLCSITKKYSIKQQNISIIIVY